ncbi:transglycosylase domain-containing protein [Halobacillus litoralis]|uniref:transglycosylase domain-containing protein n=1 Tax=Halobacillus litoralis TaxID=45668 RepID=UPI001CFCEC1A|nr:transglycosylase domain-containing protein [Halobacillus litoralis]
MSNNQKNGRNKLDFRSLWKKGSIQKNSRITYDVVWNVLLFFIIIGVIGLFFAGGVGAGYFASLVKDEPIRSKEEMKENIYNYSETSTMFFTGGPEIGDVSSDLYREEVKLGEVSSYLKNAVVATEDEYFKEHKGVVPKAIMRAVVQEVTNSSVKTGGSTLTQQLVKNQILTNEVSFERKAKEMLLALRVERFFDKDEILEAYLNIVPFGRNSNGQNIAGVQTAAQGIFGVSANELSLPQAAFIAGLPQAPFGYTPFNNDGTVKSQEELEPGIDRMHEVLERMLEAEYITKAEYDTAMDFQLSKETLAEPKATANSKYPAINQEIQTRAKEKIKKYLIKENGHTAEDLAEDEELRKEYEELAERELTTGGYQIHTTLDKKIYETMDKVRAAYNNDSWPGRTDYVKDENNNRVVDEETGKYKTVYRKLQLGSVLLENSTGRILGFIGGIDFEDNQVNHANSQRLVGSTIKPLLVYGPSIDLGAGQPGSVYADVPYKYRENGKPVNNYPKGYHGFVSMRQALLKSYNIPAAKQFYKIKDQKPAENYLMKMGFPYGHNYESSALGTDGYTVETNANGYSTLGNMGKYVDAFMIEKIETRDGETVYEHKSKQNDVFSPQAAYLTLDMMRDVLKPGGTASMVKGLLNNRGVDWAGKTGTSNNRVDSWFMATNPNVTVGMWTGYSVGGAIPQNDYYKRTQRLWSDVVNAVSKVQPELMIPDKRFESPGGLVTRSYCATSGLLASDLCSSLGLAKQDLYYAKYAPTKVDDSLIGGDFVSVKGKIVQAGPNTPREFIKDGGGVTLSPEFLKENGYTSKEILRHLIPDTSRWNKVTLPSSSSIGSTASSIDNDGQAPAVPKSVSANSSTISWNPSASKDVVGYRVYQASTPGGSFSLVGSTRKTSLPFSGDEGIYAVRAVDYFGQSSGLSSTITVGNPGAPAEETSGNSGSENDSGGSGDEDNSGDSDEENENNGSDSSNDDGGNNDSDDSNGDGSSEDSDESSGDSGSNDSSEDNSSTDDNADSVE